jgi:hypothetical protein
MSPWPGRCSSSTIKQFVHVSRAAWLEAYPCPAHSWLEDTQTHRLLVQWHSSADIDGGAELGRRTVFRSMEDSRCDSCIRPSSAISALPRDQDDARWCCYTPISCQLQQSSKQMLHTAYWPSRDHLRIQSSVCRVETPQSAGHRENLASPEQYL